MYLFIFFINRRNFFYRNQNFQFTHHANTDSNCFTNFILFQLKNVLGSHMKPNMWGVGSVVVLI